MESFYKELLAQGRGVIDVTSYMNISVSQGLEIPYVGYVELQVTAFSYTFEGLEFLIVKNSENYVTGRGKNIQYTRRTMSVISKFLPLCKSYLDA